MHPTHSRGKSGYKPKRVNKPIENYLFATKLELSKLKLNKIRDNTSKEERVPLNNLRANTNIIIGKVDKNSSIVVSNHTLNKQWLYLITMCIMNTRDSYKRNFRNYK